MPLGTFMGLATSAINNAWAEKREEEARRQNFTYNEMAANNADKRTRQMYEDYYSPSAQLKQLREAGLSPSVFFGGQGASGMSVNPKGAQGGGASGVNPNMHFIDPLTAAQIDNIKADTRKKNAETDTEQGNNNRGMAEIENILANTGKTKAETAFKDLESEWQNLQNLFFSDAREFNLDTLKYTAKQVEHAANYMWWQSEREHLQFDFEGETFEKRKEMITEQVKNIVQDTATKLALEYLYKSNKQVNEEQKKLIKQQVTYLIDSLQLGYDRLAVDQDNAESAQKQARAAEKNAETAKKQQEALKDYQDKMVQLYEKQFQVNGKDWFNAGKDILNNVIHGATTIGTMYFLKGMKMPMMSGAPIMWGQGYNAGQQIQ